MGDIMELRKIVVLATAALGLFSLSAAVYYHAARLPAPIAIDTRGHPSIGEGAIEIVIFEDFRCTGCRIFSEEIFPQISTLYIETGLARFTIIPLAFLDGSRPLANAALGVFDLAPDRFHPFVRELFRTHATNRREILSAAQKVGGIDLYYLARCIDAHLYDEVLDGNLNWARQLLGHQFGTPTLFVGGIPTSTASFEAVAGRIAQIEKRR
jgi:protein-disulfide isomerase